VAETADLKSLARNVLQRDSTRDSQRDTLSRDCLGGTQPPRQHSEPVSAPLVLVPAPYRQVFALLQQRCPEHIELFDWRRTVEDGRRFLARWGEKAEALGWTSRDLFGLHRAPDKPAPNYRRLSRYDETGLIWLLRGRAVVALTASTAAINNPTGAVTAYRKNNKPTLGPTGDSLDDFHDAGGVTRHNPARTEWTRTWATGTQDYRGPISACNILS
jgi:hypothetical protein